MCQEACLPKHRTDIETLRDVETQRLKSDCPSMVPVSSHFREDVGETVVPNKAGHTIERARSLPPTSPNAPREGWRSL